MPNEPHTSPVDAEPDSLTFDASTREVKLEQTPGEQPVTVAGAAHGPATESKDGAENEARAPESDEARPPESAT